jgi:hypothetical protein
LNVHSQQNLKQHPVKVCGFSFVRNGIKFDYPMVEAIRSILPLCDKVIVAVGKSEDQTLETIKSIDPKVEAFETVWDESLREGGSVLAVETNKAFQAIGEEYDWAFYIQGDEVIHEKYLPNIEKAMRDNLNQKHVDGLLLRYVHFYGSYDFVGLKQNWYRREIRIVRNRKDIFSYKDAQGFRKRPNEKLSVKLIDAEVYHYGYVKEPVALQKKVDTLRKFYKNEIVPEDSSNEPKQFEYEGMKQPVKKFEGTHPKLMEHRISQKNWPYNPDFSLKYSSFKDQFKRTILKWTGWMPGEYKNYKMVK